MARLLEGEPLRRAVTPPATPRPLLMCSKERKPTRHAFDSFRPVVFGLGEQLAAEMFCCQACGALRQWGLQ